MLLLHRLTRRVSERDFLRTGSFASALCSLFLGLRGSACGSHCCFLHVFSLRSLQRNEPRAWGSPARGPFSMKSQGQVGCRWGRPGLHPRCPQSQDPDSTGPAPCHPGISCGAEEAGGPAGSSQDPPSPGQAHSPLPAHSPSCRSQVSALSPLPLLTSLLTCAPHPKNSHSLAPSKPSRRSILDRCRQKPAHGCSSTRVHVASGADFVQAPGALSSLQMWGASDLQGI